MSVSSTSSLLSSTNRIGFCFKGASQCEIERGPGVFHAFRGNESTVPRNDSLDRGQADPGAFEFGLVVQPLKCAEQLARVGRVEADAVVTRKEGGRISDRSLSDLDSCVHPLSGEFPCVPEEILENDREQVSVGGSPQVRLDLAAHDAIRV